MTAAAHRDSAAVRAQRKVDLLLASGLMRWHANVAFGEIEPRIERAWRAMALARHLRDTAASRSRVLARLLGPTGAAAGTAASLWLVLRRLRGLRRGLFRWLRRGLIGWRLWRVLRRSR